MELMTRNKRRGPKKVLHKRETVGRNLAKTVLQYAAGKRFTPSTFQELAKYLGIAEVHISLFQEILDHLVKKGDLILNKERYSLPQTAPLVTGIISIHPKGFGFVKNEAGPDVFIPKHCCNLCREGSYISEYFYRRQVKRIN